MFLLEFKITKTEDEALKTICFIVESWFRTNIIETPYNNDTLFLQRFEDSKIDGKWLEKH